MGVKFGGGLDTFPWGQFRGWLLPDITAVNPPYLLWILNLTDISVDLRSMVDEEVNTVRFELALAAYRKTAAIQRNVKRSRAKRGGRKR